MKKIVLVFLFFISSLAGFAQPGRLDETFNPNDAGFGKGDGANNGVEVIAHLSNGKTLISGWFTSYNGKPCGRIARLNADGSFDETFNVGGNGANGLIRTLTVGPDGKILIGGSFTRYNGTTRNRIARLNSDGTLDADFDPGIGPNSSVNSIVIQSDGKIVIGGPFNIYHGIFRNRIARLNSDGTLDASFDPQGGANGEILSIAVQNDNKIFIAGEFTTFNGAPRSRIARLNENGTLDLTFDPGTGTNSVIRTIALQQTAQGQKILIGGEFTSYNGTVRWGLARINNNGTFDSNFDPAGSGTDNTVRIIKVRDDGKILIGGDFILYSGTTSNRIVRLNSDGTFDNSFNPGEGPNWSITAILVQPDGKMLIAGYFSSYNKRNSKYLTRVNENGLQDLLFNPGSGTDYYVYTTAFQNGKLLIAGGFTVYNNVTARHIARLQEDGTLDASFNAGGSGANRDIRKITVLPNGKILISGYFTEYNGKPAQYLARLHADGTLDESFNRNGSGPDNFITTHAVFSNGKIVITGNFSQFNGVTRNSIARLHPDGSLDTDFDPGASVGADRIFSLLPQGDKIIIGGNFTSYNNIPKNNIARINSNGLLDNTFNAIGSGANRYILDMIAQPDGKILISGPFTTYNGTARNFIARLHPDGSLDIDFDPGSGFNNGEIYSMAMQQDGKILIGGKFSQYNGTGRNNLARLLPNGALDQSFDPQSGPNGETFTLALQEDGHIIIGGEFTAYDGTGRNRLARIKGDNHTITLQLPVSTQFCPGSQVTVAYTKTGFYRLANQFAVQLSDVSGSFTNATTIGTANTSEAGNITATIPANITLGSGYRIRIVSSLPALASASNAADLTISASTSITTQPQPQTLCAGSAASFSVAATGSGLTYQWQKDGAAIAGATATNYHIPSAVTSNAGNYQVVVTGTCGIATSQSVALTVNATPAIPVISASGNTLSSSATSNNQWFLNSTAIPSATGSTYQVTAGGTYTVQVSQNGCTSTSAPYQFVATSISGPGIWNGEVSLYPNPFINQISLRNTGGRKLSIQLYDIHGKAVRQWYTAQTTAILDVTGLASGVYQIVLTDAAKNTAITQTIIKR